MVGGRPNGGNKGAWGQGTGLIATMRKVGISEGDVTTRADRNTNDNIQKQRGEVGKEWGWPDANKSPECGNLSLCSFQIAEISSCSWTTTANAESSMRRLKGRQNRLGLILLAQSQPRKNFTAAMESGRREQESEAPGWEGIARTCPVYPPSCRGTPTAVG